MFKFLISCLFLIFFVSCQTIHYTNKSQVPSQYTYSKWHHIGIMGLMEFSPPANVKAICEDKGWKAVRTQKNVLQAVVAAAIQFTLGRVSQFLGWLTVYTPEEVSVACNKS